MSKKTHKSNVSNDATPATVTAEPVAPVTIAKRTIEKDREMQNGVKRPSAGGSCRAVWDYCAEQLKATGSLPSVKQVKEHAANVGWNVNNASIEYYQFRKFSGIRGRTAASAPAAQAA